MTTASSSFSNTTIGKKRPRQRRLTLDRKRVDAWCTPSTFKSVVLFVALTLALSIQELNRDDNDDLLADILPAWFVDWVNPELHYQQSTTANVAQMMQATTRTTTAGQNNNQGVGGILHQRPFVEHEVRALIDGEEDEDLAALNNNNNNNKRSTWLNVEQLFEKKDAAVQQKWWNTHQLVHVVHTRLLPTRSRLLDFTAARLAQFQTFTLPSLGHQTNDEFLWIIWTSPTLLEETESKLKQMLSSAMNEQILANVVVVQEKNKRRYDIRDSWYDDTFDQSYILTGSYRLLMSYHAAAKNHAVLDTYLDSEDAVRLEFVDNLQQEAAQALSQPTSFRAWCPSHVLEWGYVSPSWHVQLQQDLYQLSLAEKDQTTTTTNTKTTSDSNTTTITEQERGFFSTKRSTEKCLSSAGTTVGFGSNSSARTDFSVFLKVQADPRQWHTTVMPCDHPGEANCLGFLSDDRNKKRDRGYELASSFNALSRAVLLRSKTIVAAETKGITAEFPDRPKPSAEAAFAAQDKMWKSLERLYGISPQSVQQFRMEFRSNMDKILLDMLTICLPSNACSPKNKKTLQKMLTSVGLKKVPKLVAELTNDNNNDNNSNEKPPRDGKATEKVDEQ